MLAYVIFLLYLCSRFCARLWRRAHMCEKERASNAGKQETKTSKIYVYEI